MLISNRRNSKIKRRVLFKGLIEETDGYKLCEYICNTISGVAEITSHKTTRIISSKNQKYSFRILFHLKFENKRKYKEIEDLFQNDSRVKYWQCKGLNDPEMEIISCACKTTK